MRKKDDSVLTEDQRKKILKKYDYVCVYCFGDADEIDHVIPWSYIHRNDEENLVASCWLCNLVASNKVFDYFQEKQQFIQKRRYEWIKNNPIPLWTKKELSELSYALRKKVELSAVILNDDIERDKTKEKLLKEGFRVFGW